MFSMPLIAITSVPVSAIVSMALFLILHTAAFVFSMYKMKILSNKFFNVDWPGTLKGMEDMELRLNHRLEKMEGKIDAFATDRASISVLKYGLDETNRRIDRLEGNRSKNE